MARKTLIAGNWKMNCLTADGTTLAKDIASKVKENKFDCEFLDNSKTFLLKSVYSSRIYLKQRNAYLESLSQVNS